MQELPADNVNTVVQHLSTSAALLNAEGTILDVSEGWKAFAHEGGMRLRDYGIGANYLKYCVFPDKSSVDVVRGLQQVMLHQADCFATLYPCDSPQLKRWFLMAAFATSGTAARATVLHFNVSSLIRESIEPSAIMVGRGPAAADEAQEALARVVKRSVAEALSMTRSPSHNVFFDPSPAERRKFLGLAQQELKLLRLLAEGASNSDIAKALGISADAAKFRVVSLTRKLGLKNRTQAAVFAVNNGLLTD
jgi:DNA-binding NarL/FixJ family response regulator